MPDVWSVYNSNSVKYLHKERTNFLAYHFKSLEDVISDIVTD